MLTNLPTPTLALADNPAARPMYVKLAAIVQANYDMAMEVLASERAQLQLHLDHAQFDADSACPCSDCTGVYPYDERFYRIARRYAQQAQPPQAVPELAAA